jgi:hypothetical protein
MGVSSQEIIVFAFDHFLDLIDCHEDTAFPVLDSRKAGWN